MGRKPLADIAKSDRPLKIRLTDGERDELERAAGKTPVSTWARDTLLAIARKQKGKNR